MLQPAVAQETSTTNRTAEIFLREVREQFKAWDADDDGVLTVGEMDEVIGDPAVTGQAAAAIAALKRASRSTKLEVPPFTLENLAQLATNAPATNRPNLLRMFTEGLRQITNAPNRDLFASGRPRLETIRQGKLGNCFTLAPLGAMVHRDPDQVVAMFRRAENGSYTVRLGERLVAVLPPTEAELALTSSNERDGIWVNLYEKAVGQARNELRPPAEQFATAIDSLARGGSAGTMLAFITGHEISRFSFKYAKDPAVTVEERAAKLAELRSQLARAVGERRLMTCGTTKPTTPGITPNHAYAVLDFRPESDAVLVWDPHGDDFKPKGEPGARHGYPRKDGMYWLPVEEFIQQFSGMAFELTPSPAGQASVTH